MAVSRTIARVAVGMAALLVAGAYPLRYNLTFRWMALMLGVAFILIAIFLLRWEPSSARTRGGQSLSRAVIGGVGTAVLLGAGTLLVGPVRAPPALLGIALILVAIFVPALGQPGIQRHAGTIWRRVVVAGVGIGMLVVAVKPPVGKPPWIAATGVALFLLALALRARVGPIPKP